MPSTTKNDLVMAAGYKSGLSQADCRRVAEGFFATLSARLLMGDTIFIRGFGTFLTRTHKARPARNVSTGATVLVPERRVVRARLTCLPG